MSVKLRKKSIKGEKASLYLDVYVLGNRHTEFLKLYLFKKPKNVIEKTHNKETQLLAESIRSKRELEINSEEHGFIPTIKRATNFMDYFQKFANEYKKKDHRLVTGCLNHFKTFLGKDFILSRDINEKLLLAFKEYLNSKLKGETPANYFSKLKKVLRQALKDKIILENPAEFIINKKNDSIKKEILTSEEIQILANTNCYNIEIKRAFLFSCMTGLRFCDIELLRWADLNGNILKISQSKTGVNAIINLNSSAQKILKEQANKNELVFNLPSHNTCLKHLKNWVKNAKISKKITWHCARHSFGTNLIFHGADVKTASGLLGHTNMNYTNRYLHEVNSLKQTATDNLPEIDF